MCDVHNVVLPTIMFQYTQYIATVECINRQKGIDITSFLPLAPMAVAATMSMEHQTADYVAIHFLSDSSMRRLHLKYYNDSSSTDCMSFPIDMDENESTGQRILGDIFICPQVAQRMGKKESTSTEHELCLYTIHATLHLLGYDDINVDDRTIMREKEQKALQLLEHIRNYGTI